MHIIDINNYLKAGILAEMKNGSYKLKAPITIVVDHTVIEKLKKIYQNNYERGGLLIGNIYSSSVLKISDFVEVKNTAVNSYSYTPLEKEWNEAVNNILEAGALPFAVHTHPTQLGFSSYDSRRENFYYKPSSADMAIARDGIQGFNLPETIFVADDRYKNGYALNFFTGFIFPRSIKALTWMQGIAAGISVLSLAVKKYKLAAIGAGAYFYEEYKRPTYKEDANGNFIITVKR